MYDTTPEGRAGTAQALWAQGARVFLRPRATDSAALRVLTRICPGGCFKFDVEDRVTFAPATCTYCGTCLSVCRRTGEVVWEHPDAPTHP
ncbi:hypothetical protein N0B44_11585 [Roseibacterium beibuensis]|uniref:4Fe-4S ferredoxin-type domain-containing protein n=1 Tax=[Roseibacterium] beibuensis TaxID=1193142 RepID=A0ABP9LJB3_9RHOB|nr:hypothetical protein [Roseibacterium beibuensis]MCS6623557.1 hypothetical protein [Roseibacterium beibuensis]